jgi:hypothetical protein
MALTAVGLGTWALWPAAQDPVSRFEVARPTGAGIGAEVSLSPDGRKLALDADGALWIRDFATLEWRRLPGTEGGVTPFWSPDGRYLGFSVGREIKKIAVAGGPPETLATLPTDASGSGSWSRNGDLLVGAWGGGSGGPIWRVPETGGAPAAVTEVDLSAEEFYHSWPTFLADGEHFLYFRSGPDEIQGMYVGSLGVEPGKQSRQRLLPSAVPAAYARGYLFFVRARTLMAQRFDDRRMQLEGVPVPVAGDVSITWFSMALFSVPRAAPWLIARRRRAGPFSSPGSIGKDSHSARWHRPAPTRALHCHPMAREPS